MIFAFLTLYGYNNVYTINRDIMKELFFSAMALLVAASSLGGAEEQNEVQSVVVCPDNLNVNQ